MGKLKRSALLHYLKNPSSTGLSPEHHLIGKDVEDASVELNPDVESIKNILDEVSVNDKGYDPSMDVETYYANPDDGWFYEWIKNIAMNRLTGDDCKTVYTEVLVDKTPDEAKGSYDAWQEDVIVKPQSYGGAQGGISIPFNIAFCGNRVQGTATLGTKLSLGSFSANSTTTTSTTNS